MTAPLDEAALEAAIEAFDHWERGHGQFSNLALCSAVISAYLSALQPSDGNSPDLRIAKPQDEIVALKLQIADHEKWHEEVNKEAMSWMSQRRLS